MKRRKNDTTIRESLNSVMAPSALLFFHHMGEAVEKPSYSSAELATEAVRKETDEV